VKRLDDLLDATEPHATFHDAEMIDLHIDYVGRTLDARFDLCVGDPDGVTELHANPVARGVSN
jgi:hypothetical protein